MTATECKSDFKLTTHTPYLALTGELWGLCYENFEKIDRVTTAPHVLYMELQNSVLLGLGCLAMIMMVDISAVVLGSKPSCFIQGDL